MIIHLEAFYSQCLNSFYPYKFNSFDVSYVPRSCNRYAHELVRMGMSWDPNQSYLRIDHLPDFVNILAVGDIRELSVTLMLESLCFFLKIDRPTQATVLR